ncbi:alpha-D-glucose phosphate-specific phosphoglucomutase [Erythrobacter sp. LQ02-29]|uniref:alpha-D-glucose phosphate-specific phosphoglucomutase n=1 Tax=Erythrobacter sp. LQ02-29 TaxID=2920384 RepID=UPI001F4DFE54|nr:alpha-D-glucose phosphate-specific phosphoglucomutase [Erythrobacter sp. LQ02-29]MCP9222065.1 alpha-D-glucose phosphate-specific phosphoglucomutase [Erythrobacter sp. LQ02-29]
MTHFQPITVSTTPFEGQKPGTSGLRKQTEVFRQEHYAENFIQSVFDTIKDRKGATLVIGGDGRFHNQTVAQTAIRMAVANGFGRVVVGRNAWLSTPAASHLIRKHDAIGGLILSASHNPGGPDGDFGIKFNIANGGPAPEAVTQAIHARSETIAQYRLIDSPELDLTQLGSHDLNETMIDVVDPVADYADLMESLFDFPAIAALLADGFTIRMDAMHAITGPYAMEILERRLGAPAGSVINAEPLPDFGGGHPDPNLVHAEQLHDTMMSADGPDFGAASDGDGDRNLILGKGIYVSPSDSLAVLAANAHLVPAFLRGIAGVARSMPTSRAADRVAERLGVEAYETPTGWKFFGTLLDAGKVSICGEESAGTGADHVREKDGLWAILFWLNVIAARREPVAQIMADHWQRYGRDYYARHDYEALDTKTAQALMGDLKEGLADLAGTRAGELTVERADSFSYNDPVDGSVSENQGLRLFFTDGSRAVLRLSGTGTQGATLRVYLERYEPPSGQLDRDVGEVLVPLADAVDELAGIKSRTGRDAPDVVT